ncbi:MAG TPA: tetratricopeptide repeat protein [Kofleriaceae bacterium]|nr:tetratricopeptide repeat protein [Kofleriaceae bacterium]
MGIAVGVAVLAIVAVIAVPRLRTTKVWVVNGLEVPVVAEVDGHRLEIGPQSRAAKSVRGRSIEVVIRGASGGEIDREDLDASADQIVFNVLGATPLAIEGQIYNRIGITTYEPKPPERLDAQRVIDRDDLDFYWELPREIRQPADGEPVIEKRVLIVRGAWWDTVQTLIETSRPNEALALVKKIGAAQPGDRRVAALLAELEGPANVRRDPVGEPGRPAASTTHDWVLASADGQARLFQERLPHGTCAARCERGGTVVWRATVCLGTAYQARFVAPDCTRAIVIDTSSIEAGDARTKPAVFVYAGGALAESHPPADYVDPDEIPDDGMWTFGKPRLSADGRTVELATRDRKLHRIALVP